MHNATLPKHPAGSLPALTSLRGLAALWVFFHHLFLEGLLAATVMTRAIAAKGYMAVEFFFVLSGFVVAFAYAKMFVSLGIRLNALAYFYGQRFFRIYPLHLFLLAWVMASEVMGTMFVSDSAARTWTDPPSVVWLANIALMQSWWINIPSVIVPAWSASTEILASILFPVLVIMIFRVPALMFWLIGACIFWSIYWLIETNPGKQLSIWYGWRASIRCLMAFSLGIMSYRAYGVGVLRSCLAANVTGVLLISGFVLSCLLGLYDLVSFSLIPFIVMSVSYNEGYVKRVLNLRLLLWLGNISFSVYLIHFLVIRAFTTFVVNSPGQASSTVMAACVACFVVVILLSHYCYEFVETPCRAWGRQYLKSLQPQVTHPVQLNN